MDDQNFFIESGSSQFTHPEVKLKSVTRLLKESLEIYRSKIKTLLGIMILPVGFSLLATALTNFLGATSFQYSVWFSVTKAIFYLFSFLFWFWVLLPVFYSLKENLGAGESCKKGLKVFFSYLWVFFLLWAIIQGGILLLIIPGILFSFWFSLAFYVLVFEEKKGFDALLRSKQLISGNFWGVAWRFSAQGLIVIATLLPAALISYFTKANPMIMGEIWGYFFQLFVLPVFLVYEFLIYKNLEEIKQGTVYRAPSGPKKGFYLVPITLGTLIIGLMFTLLLLNVFWGVDEPPPNDRDLRLSKVEILRENNAFYDFSSAGEKLYIPKGKTDVFINMADGKEWDNDFAKELMENNQETFYYFEKALKFPQYQYPPMQDPETFGPDTPVYPLSPIRNIARLNSIGAAYFSQAGKQKDAFEQTIKTIKMGQMLEDSPRGYILEYLTGGAAKEIGLHRLRLMLPSANLSKETLVSYLKQLDSFRPRKEKLANLFRMDYANFVNAQKIVDPSMGGDFSSVSASEPWQFEFSNAKFGGLGYFYKFNQTRRIFVEYYRSAIDSAQKDYCSEMEITEVKSLAPSSKLKIIFTENFMGKILHDMAGTIFGPLFYERCKENFSITGTQLLIAIRSYWLEKGVLPNSLEALVPEYIPEAPKDPFNGKPVRYLPEKKIIYSVGKDLKDSNGGQGDLLFEIGF